MNFIDSLTLLFLTLSAVKVSCSENTGHKKKKIKKKKKSVDLYLRNVATGH